MREKILEIMKSVRPSIDFENEKSLIDDELLESFDIISIVTELMDSFDIYIDADDIEPENLNSLDAVCELVESKLVR